MDGSPAPGSGRQAARRLHGYLGRACAGLRPTRPAAVERLRIAGLREIWRIASDTPGYGPDDFSGKGAEKSGGRWNRKGIPLVYAASSIALACAETVLHLAGPDPLPLRRYLVRIEVGSRAWRLRTVFDVKRGRGWDALPAGLASLDWGTRWAQAGRSLLAEIPSVVVPEESNFLINPRHPGIASLRVVKARPWHYDLRPT